MCHGDRGVPRRLKCAMGTEVCHGERGLPRVPLARQHGHSPFWLGKVAPWSPRHQEHPLQPSGCILPLGEHEEMKHSQQHPVKSRL